MSSVNKVILIGTLGRDPEIRSTQDGKRIANLSVATSERWKDKNGERKDKTEWHRVVIYNDGLSGVAQSYLKKGSQVYLEGSLQTRKWTDKDGNEKYSTEVVLQNFSGTLVMLTKDHSEKQEAKKEDAAWDKAAAILNGDESEIPF